MRSERDSNSRYGFSFNVCAAPTQNASNDISRGDWVAILEKQKAAPKGRLFDLMLIYQHLILVAGQDLNL